jgi:hypothetical protein
VNVGEACDLNTLLRWLFRDDDATEEAARAAAVRLADRAHKAVSAGLRGSRGGAELEAMTEHYSHVDLAEKHAAAASVSAAVTGGLFGVPAGAVTPADTGKS